MKPVIATQSTDLASSVEAVWPLVTATDRQKRWLGLPAIRPRPSDKESRSAARFIVDTSSAGIPTTYEEHHLADDWGQDRTETLRAFLHGVPAGMVELRWGVICPSCRTASEQFKALEEISDMGHCQLCDITFELELDKSVEATFVAHEAKDLVAPREEGRYRFFARGGAAARMEVAKGGPEKVAVAVDEKSASPAELHIAPGGTVNVTNDTDEDRHVKIERLGYASTAATAHFVSKCTISSGSFRASSSSERRRSKWPGWRSSSATSPARPRCTPRSAMLRRFVWWTITSTSSERWWALTAGSW